MTPEERELVRNLFVRLAELEREQRDPDAERLIREGQSRAPNAVYSLVQTVLLQDEALRAADERIAELEDQVADAQPAPQQRQDTSFLGGARSKWNSGEVMRGSVPSVGRGDEPMGAPRGFGSERGYPGGYQDEPVRGGPGAMPYGGEPPRSGGSFLGAAAAAAAGAIGGGLLMGGIRSALGGHGDQKGPFAGAIDQLGGKSQAGAAGSAAGGDLSRDAGLGDIGGNRQSAMQTPHEDQGQDDADIEDDDSDLVDDEEMDDAMDDEE